MFKEVKARESNEGVCAEGVCPVSSTDVAAPGRGRAGLAGSPLPLLPTSPEGVLRCHPWDNAPGRLSTHPLLPIWPDSLQGPLSFHHLLLPFSLPHPELLLHSLPRRSVVWAPESFRLVMWQG